MSQTYSIPSNQNTFDAFISISVPIDNIISVMKSNGYNINVDFQVTKGSLVYDNTSVVAVKGGQTVKNPSPGVSTYTTNSTQNIFDVCLNSLGDLNKIILLIQNNTENLTNINSPIDTVLNVNYNDSDVTDNGFKKAVKMAKIEFTTGDLLLVEELELLLLQENGYYLLQENGDYILY